MRNIWRVFWLFLCVLLLTQCVNCKPAICPITGPISQHKILFIDQSYNDDQKLAIIKAAQQWETKTNSIISYEFDTFFGKYGAVNSSKYNSIVITPVGAGDTRVIALDKEAQKKHKDSFVLAFYEALDPIPTIYVVNSRLDNSNSLERIMLHEFGHALKMDHNDIRDSIMNSSLPAGSPFITQKDLLNFCQIYFCKEEDLKKN